MTEEVSRKPTAAVRDFDRRAAMGAGLAAAMAVLAGAATTNTVAAAPLKKHGSVQTKTGTKALPKNNAKSFPESKATKKTGTKAFPKADNKNLPK